jgi:carboxypeptidase C (cathepsin A)
VTETPDFDPSLSAIRPPFTTMLNDYLRSDLRYETDAEYHILRGLEWDWGSAEEGYPKTSEALAGAFAKNPYLRLFVASGYYDLATPYFATDYTLNHLPFDPATRDNVRTEEYPVGHMVYLEKQTLAKLQADVAGFIADATSQEGRPLRG